MNMTISKTWEKKDELDLDRSESLVELLTSQMLNRLEKLKKVRHAWNSGVDNEFYFNGVLEKGTEVQDNPDQDIFIDHIRRGYERVFVRFRFEL